MISVVENLELKRFFDEAERTLRDRNIVWHISINCHFVYWLKILKHSALELDNWNDLVSRLC